MIGPLSPATATRLEKAAIDNGFDQELPAPEGWLGFASTQAPLRIWLTALGDDLFLVTLSQHHVSRALGDHGTPMASPLPEGATAGRTVTDIPALHRLVRRAFQLSRTLPDELLHVFEKKTAALPKTTEAERLVVQRVGQDIFRAGLIDYWEGRCAITGLAVPDRGFITLADDGTVVVSQDLDADAREALGLHQPLREIGIADRHRHYLPWHREKVFLERAANMGSQP